MRMTSTSTGFVRALGCVVVALWATLAVGAQQPGVHPVSGRVFAQTMSVAGAPWLDREERESEEHVDLALRLLRIPSGAVVADVGAGSGYVTVRLARIVGAAGMVYANDIQPGMLDLVRRKMADERLANITPVLGTIADPRLPRDTLDLVILVDVYHEFSEPQAMLQRIRESLKPDGRLVLLEYRGEDPSVPIRPDHKMTRAQVRQELEHEGFTLVTVHDDLPRQHVFEFRKS